MKPQKVSVVGLGYVGLPLAKVLIEANHTVFGIDCDPTKIRDLDRQSSYVEDVTDSDLVAMNASGRFSYSRDFSKIERSNVVIICVPTPVKENLEPDLSYLIRATTSVAEFLKPETLVISESTSFPGTLRNILKPILDGGMGLNSGDYFLAVAPERINPGNQSFVIRDVVRVIGGLTDSATNAAVTFYKTFVDSVVPVSSPEVAEAAKLLENTFRQVNIALVNEVSNLASALKIDIKEVIEAAATKPYGFMKFMPGAGVGGHCIPVDPHYLTWLGRENGVETPLIDSANEVNRLRPQYVIRRISQMMDGVLEGKRILVAGLAYKAGVSDIRESPSVALFMGLEQCGANVEWFDKKVKVFSGKTKSELFGNFDAVVIVLPDLELPITKWLESGAKVLDCSFSLNKDPRIQRL